MGREVVGSFSVNPLHVEAHLAKATFSYPMGGEADEYRGWGAFAVIPGLFQWMVEHSRFPGPDDGVAFLMQHCDPRYRGDPKVRRRAEKLYMDYCRDMHTKGLLERCTLMAWVQYQKALDLGYDVDFVCGLLAAFGGPSAEALADLAVRAKMRHPRAWRDGVDPWEEPKMRRRQRRGTMLWTGPSFVLSNQYRPAAQSIQGCWLFGAAHIFDLRDEILAEYGLESDEPTPAVAVKVEQLGLWE